tara:strand:+ start:24273 stop:24956 length:684 start_codon:yes stop_codon:yes gene_type:complete
MTDLYDLSKIQSEPDLIKPVGKRLESQDPRCTPCLEETITYQRSFRDVPGERVSLDEVKAKRKRETCGGACFLCGRAGFAGDESTAVGRMYKMFRNEYSNHDSDELFANLEIFFKEEIYNLYKEQGMDCPLLTKEQLRVHFLQHTLEPSTFLSEEIRSLRDVADILKNNLLERNIQGNVDVNEKELKKLISVQQQIVQLYRTPISSMNFFDPTTTVFKKNKQARAAK